MSQSWSIDEKTAQLGESHADNGDDYIIEQLGYQPAYRRVLRTIGSIAVVIAIASPMCGIFVISNYMVVYGGYWGLTWGWLLAAVILFAQPLAVAELCSAMPVNGSFYWWTAALAPRRISRALSYVVGWTSMFSILAALASFAFAIASSYASLIALLHPTWIPTRPQELGISIAIVVVWAATSTMKMERFAWILIFTSFIVLITSLVYIIGLPVSHAVQGRPFAPAAQAFGKYTNYSEWNQAVAVPMTFFSVAWAVTGWQAPAAVAEETHDARRTAPKSIISSYALMAGFGVVVCWIAAFCVTDMDALASDPSGLPLFTLVIDHWGTRVAVAYILVCFTCTAIGGSSLVLSSSSQIAAFARDGGLPFAKTFSTVSQRTNMPWACILLLMSGAVLLLLFALSQTASTIIYSLAVISVYMTYATPIALRIFAGKRWTPGPFHYGRLSIPIHMWALASILWLIVMEAFPSTPAWTIATFNYNWVVASGVILLSVIFWFALGRKVYKGIDLAALDHARSM